MNVMDPQLRVRLAEWLAYHLSNFEYMWPWAKWVHVLAAPAYDGQRYVSGSTISDCVSLTVWQRHLTHLCASSLLAALGASVWR